MIFAHREDHLRPDSGFEKTSSILEAANPIIVMTDQLIKKAMNKLEAARRMVQWAIELSQFDVEYYPRNVLAQDDQRSAIPHRKSSSPQ